MPAKDQRVVGSHRDQVLRYLIDHPGSHRPTEIASALPGLSTQQVANACWQLHTHVPGTLQRGTREPLRTPGGRPYTTYAATPQARESVGTSGQGES